MPTNITNYGAREGEDTIEAAEANVAAIVAAAEADPDTAVYVPAGEFYVGHGSRGAFLSPGDSAIGHGGAAGVSVYGAGPRESFLTVASGVPGDVGLQIRYDDSVDHGNVVWQDVTYDGNYEAVDLQPLPEGNQRGITFSGSADVTLQNVRLRNFNAAAVKDFGGVTYEIDRCTFRENGIGSHNATDGDAVSHHLAIGTPGGETSRITNSLFELVSGTVMDVDGTGSVEMHNCFCRSAGDALMKVIDAGADISQVYFEGATDELSAALSTDGPAPRVHHGRLLVYRLVGDESVTPTIRLNDVEAHSLPYHVALAFPVRNECDMELTGGDEGPVAFHDVASVRRSAFNAVEDCDMSTFDFEQLSLHGVDGELFSTPDTTGRIGTLARDDTNGLGDPGGITIESDRPGADPFQPTTPSRDAVGIGTAGPTVDVSWTRPTDGATVTGAVDLAITASEAQTVEYRVDDGAWTTASDAGDGTYTDQWDPSAPGEYRLTARATGPEGATATATVTVTVTSPVFRDWTPRWDATRDDWRLVSGPEYAGDTALVFRHDGDKRQAFSLSWDEVGEPADVELLDRFRVPQFETGDDLPDYYYTGYHAQALLRASGGAGSTNGYWVEIEDHNESFRLGKYVNGDVVTLARFGTPKENTFYYRRFRAVGDTIQAKVWPAGSGEPDGWDATVTDTSHDAGWVGLGSYDVGRVETDVVSVATGGDTAPFVDRGPSVSWVDPAEGASISGETAISIAASEAQSVAYRVDDGAWTTAAYDADADRYRASLDATRLAAGEHVLTARATSESGETATARRSVSVEATLGVETRGPSDVAATEATLGGEVTTLDADSADVAVAYREPDGEWQRVDAGTLSAPGTFRVTVTGLTADTAYEFRAVASGGSEATGAVRQFRTDAGGNAPPEITQFDVTDESGETWSRFEIDWAVTDPDGNLDTALSTVRNGGTPVDATATTISGESASFTHVVRVRGAVDEVRLLVNDTDNAVTERTVSV